MKYISKNWYDFELICYSTIAILFVSAVLCLFYFSPVYYTFLISEDHFAEYATSVSFGLAGLVLLVLSFISGPGIRGAVWLIIGVVLLFIAAEEISWGQRIFYIATPEIIAEHNVQNEVTLHNLAIFNSINSVLHETVAYLLIMHLIFSQLVLTYFPRVESIFTNIGVPLIPLRLVPVFLMAPFFWIFTPTVRAQEIGELFLGVVALIWAGDLLLLSYKSKRFNGYISVSIVLGVLFLVVILSGWLAHRHVSDSRILQARSARLNLSASRDYIDFKMYEQAQKIYDYIYQHPEFLRSETRINHAKLLIATGNESEAGSVLAVAARDLEAKTLQKALNNKQDSKQLRLLGEIYQLLRDDVRAEIYFDQSMGVDQTVVATTSLVEEKSEAFRSMSRTMEVRGDIAMAINYLVQAISYTQSSARRLKLEQKLDYLESR
jgi:hypothetical protein